tara:strand:- start:50 stop:304 length:255 start_codon:yes stop_codon:yes gene_type:complete
MSLQENNSGSSRLSNFKSKGYSRSRRRTITEDTLAKMSDDDLRKAFLEIRGVINKGKRQKRSVKHREIDLCYIQREIQNRKIYS